jgi:four helix bundle protein
MENKLQVWKLADQFTLDVYQISKNFPSSEKFGLTNQLRRSSSSVPTNIIEGQGRQYKKEFIQFLCIAKGSLEESNYQLFLAKDLKYISSEEYL